MFWEINYGIEKSVLVQEYVERWIWYNSDDGEDENDFVVEDVLLHYTNRTSIE